MLCIYCGSRKADAREHYLPQCLGGFRNYEPLLDKICQICNEEIGGEIELEFARRSPEAVLRSVNWVKRGGGKKPAQTGMFQPKHLGGKHLYFFAPDAQTGHNILWQTTEKPGAIREISQLLVLEAGDQVVQYIPIPTAVQTGRELAELFNAYELPSPMPKVVVIAQSGDEHRVQRLFSEIGQVVTLERRGAGSVPGPQIFTGEITPGYFRALAKIGFHYALKYIPTITGGEDSFRPLREFIRHGVGESGQFLSSCEHVSDPAGPPGHVLTAVAMPDSMIVVNMQFFSGCKTRLPQWRLILGPNPTVLHVEQASAHFFGYDRDGDGRLIGGETIEMRVAPGY